MKNTYFIWINSGGASIGEIAGEIKDEIVQIKNPYMIINMQYGVDKDGNTVSLNSPELERVKFKVDLYPYLFKEYVGVNAQFTMKIDSVPHMIINDENTPIIKQYNELVNHL